MIGCIGHFLRKTFRKTRNMSKRSIVKPVKKHLNKLSEKRKLNRDTIISNSYKNFIRSFGFWKNRENIKKSRSLLDGESSMEQELMTKDNKTNEHVALPKLKSKCYRGLGLRLNKGVVDSTNFTSLQSRSQVIHNQTPLHTFFQAYYQSKLSLDVGFEFVISMLFILNTEKCKVLRLFSKWNK